MSGTFSRLLAPVSFLQPNSTAVALGAVEVFGNPRHQQHGQQHHQHTHDPHSDVCAGRTVRGCPFSPTGGLERTIPLKVEENSSRPCSKTPKGPKTLLKVPPWDPSNTNPRSLGQSPKACDNVSPRMQWDLNEGSSEVHSPHHLTLNRGTVSLLHGSFSSPDNSPFNIQTECVDAPSFLMMFPCGQQDGGSWRLHAVPLFSAAGPLTKPRRPLDGGTTNGERGGIPHSLFPQLSLLNGFHSHLRTNTKRKTFGGEILARNSKD